MPATKTSIRRENVIPALVKWLDDSILTEYRDMWHIGAVLLHRMPRTSECSYIFGSLGSFWSKYNDAILDTDSATVIRGCNPFYPPRTQRKPSFIFDLLRDPLDYHLLWHIFLDLFHLTSQKTIHPNASKNAHLKKRIFPNLWKHLETVCLPIPMAFFSPCLQHPSLHRASLRQPHPCPHRRQGCHGRGRGRGRRRRGNWRCGAMWRSGTQHHTRRATWWSHHGTGT